MLYAFGFSAKDCEGDIAEGCALGRDFGDEEEEGDEMEEMVRGSIATPMCVLARSGSDLSTE